MAFKKPIIDRITIDSRNNLISCEDFKVAYKYLYLNKRASLKDFNELEKMIIDAFLGRITLSDLYSQMKLDRYDTAERKQKRIESMAYTVARKMFISFGRMTVIMDDMYRGSVRSLDNSQYMRDVVGVILASHNAPKASLIISTQTFKIL
ncbi:hypothetical protein AB4455_12210 [Vibrio sp. 10N.261.46.E12]|uniref:hypothetical protein n=1 Tax=unclassified Vibrio TaxID=2614977 RepID=UPI00097700D5|nr:MULTISPECIES: hypothetical protein [unclassified Vibrio]OMO34201.1 hypothetical protein BH584_13360 [Vibrio sp. 10N.261.45.E1]PMJ33149.1 hypothetical protein BCU27_25235 [Vibrio sp. 10N.286.45.B6]PML86360.1 hypothetical protein BCT66_14310 [Vibrio sp. 10N.261.49.E11]PMM77476.1 hypothetical protein BCT48_23750 [Vibrio sp. 10N.261.46.F12]PMM90622.1 hypothetical protein BCT46_03365 [Vibrio sp. 10N.261.46.E8]